jgi:agmatinase
MSALRARGFAGARIVPFAELAGRAKPGDVVFFGVAAELRRAFGRSNRNAPESIRRDTARMSPWADTQPVAFWDIGILSGQGTELLEDIVLTVTSLAGAGLRPAMIACDHLASYAAAQVLDEDVVYIYFDAHLDLGLHEGPSGLHNGNFISSIISTRGPARVINVGARSWTTYDAPYRGLTGVTLVEGRSAKAIIEGLASLGPCSAYVSIDADVLDPALFPFSCCPEPFGLSHYDLLETCQWIGRNFTIKGCDISEFAPASGDGWASEVLMQIATSLFEGSCHADRDPAAQA